MNFDSVAVIDDGSCLFCEQSVAEMLNTPHWSSFIAYGASNFVAQVFTVGSALVDPLVGLELKQCKLNGTPDAIVELVSVSSSDVPDWCNVLGSVTIDSDDIPEIPECTGVLVAELIYVQFNDVSFVSGDKYAVVLRSSGESGEVSWVRSVSGIDEYLGGSSWTQGDTNSEYSHLDLGFKVCASGAILGCSDSAACNYDSSANLNDGSCVFPDGCSQPDAWNYDSQTLCDDGSCLFIGCTDALALNFDSTTDICDNSCVYCEFSVAEFTNTPDFSGFNSVNILGQTEEKHAQTFLSTEYIGNLEVGVEIEQCKLNGAPDAIVEITTCDAFGEPEWDNIMGSQTISSDLIPEMTGCATTNAELIYVHFSNVTLHQGEMYAIILRSAGGSGEIRWPRSISGMDEFSHGKVWYFVDDFGDVFTESYDHLDVGFKVCGSELIAGCTDDLALNYSAEFEIDNGSCLYGTSICGLCTIWDESEQECVSDPICEACQGDFNGDGVISASDLTGFLGVFGGACG